MKDAIILQYEINPHDSERFPLDWEDRFGRTAPLAVEIGCGNGEFLVDWAGVRSDWNLVGIELSLAGCERIQNRLFQENLKNVRLIRDDARFVMHELFPDESVQQVMMNFPDPWPKERHQERRLIRPDFVGNLAAILVPDGIFELFTDQAWYARQALDVFSQSGHFRSPQIIENPRRPVSTKYERKWRQEGRPICQLQAIKQKKFSLHRILESKPMPHYIIPQALNPRNIIHLRGLEKTQPEQVFKIKEVFATPDQKAYLLRTVTVDKDYVQNFFVLVAPHREGFIVKIDSGFQPYRTPAVKLALREIADILSNRSPENGEKRENRRRE